MPIMTVERAESLLRGWLNLELHSLHLRFLSVGVGGVGVGCVGVGGVGVGGVGVGGVGVGVGVGAGIQALPLHTQS